MNFKKKLNILEQTATVHFTHSSYAFSDFIKITCILGCEAAIMDLPTLQSGLSCRVSNSCMGVDCCVDVQKLGLSLNFYLNLDICNNKFTVGVENLNTTISILKIEFGTIQIFSFLGLLKIR